MLDFVIPRGEAGPTGATGATGAVGPKGDQGDPGEAATITIGTVTTGAPGSDAEITNSGTDQNAVFDFVLPEAEEALRTRRVLKALKVPREQPLQLQ